MSARVQGERQLNILNAYLDELNDIKEVINDEISDVRYGTVGGEQALKTFEKNILNLLRIKKEISAIYSSELNAVHYTSVGIFKIINMLEKANLSYHDFTEEKLYSGKSNMHIYDQIVDFLVTIYQDLCKMRASIDQMLEM